MQLRAIPEFFSEPIAQRRHDTWRESHFKPETGQVGYQGNVALFLIYQPNGIEASILRTCDHLAGKGYAPLVISNTPLSKTDRTELKNRCWVFAERPNIGYDFGGYRDGLWLLGKMGVVPDNLLVLNDSVWFPIFEDSGSGLDLFLPHTAS